MGRECGLWPGKLRLGLQEGGRGVLHAQQGLLRPSQQPSKRPYVQTGRPERKAGHQMPHLEPVGHPGRPKPREVPGLLCARVTLPKGKSESLSAGWNRGCRGGVTLAPASGIWYLQGPDLRPASA